jgi:hypothetical protein
MVQKPVIRSRETLHHPNLCKNLEIFPSGIRRRIANDVRDPERAHLTQDLPQKKAKGVFFKEVIKAGLHLFCPDGRKKQVVLGVKSENSETSSPQHPF